MPTFRTLFSGGELFGTGAKAAGWTHVDGYELRGDIAAVARLNGFAVRQADVCEIAYASLVPVDHLHASPSCKTASQANTSGVETPEDLACADAIARAIKWHAVQGGRSFSLENVWAYRNYQSFARILAALVAADFAYTFDHVNMADFGVPQTRKRLILRATRRSWHERVPGLRPTHSKRGGLMLERWNGWYDAISDLVDGLPDTEPAPWQLDRMPRELRESLLISPAKSPNGSGIVTRGPAEPATTITAGGADGDRLVTRAYLVSNGGEHGDLFRPPDDPAPVVTTQSEGRTRAYLIHPTDQRTMPIRDGDDPAFTVMSPATRDGHQSRWTPRAYIVGGGNTQRTLIDSVARADDLPMFTVSASDGSRKAAAAYLFGDQSASNGEGVQIRTGDDPALTIRSGRREGLRAYAAGRWVRMTIQPLGRFQTVPDSYIGLTPEINGNGVPPWFAQQLMETLL